MRRFILATCLTLALQPLAALAATDSFRFDPALGVASSAASAPSAAGALKEKPSVSKQLAADVPQTQPEPQRQRDNAANIDSDVFGANLFTGAFARQGATAFNPDYRIAIGDRIQVRLWGAFNFDEVLVVDPQGNLFLPHVGPVKVLGITNNKLQSTIENAASRVFKANVSSYASLAAAQPVRVFVGGFVNRPGLYQGTSMDSLLHYLDQAGGIDATRGTFLKVQVKRGEQVRATVNLYDFLLKGSLPLVQLADGDVIFVPPRHSTVQVRGLAQNAKRFEFVSPELSITELVLLAKPRAEATHVRVVRNTGTIRNVDYYEFAEANGITVGNGDEVEFTADKKPGTITVRVEGEHLSAQEYVLPYGSRLGELVSRIEFSDRSETQNVQLFRRSVRERQKVMLGTALKSLESTVLTARSGTSDEARLRKEEAEIILQWVDRAKSIEPAGQVLIAQAAERDSLLLENGDIIRIPTRDGLVLVSGEVLFPNAVAYDDELSLEDYIGKAGGYTQSADNSRVVIAHRDGSFDQGGDNIALRPGDEVLVLPKVDVKSRQIWKDMTQIIYQIAVSAKVVFGL